MPSRFHLARVVAAALALPLALAAPLAGQGLKVSGFAEASYAWSNHADGTAIVGHVFDRFSDQFMLNGFHLAAEKSAGTNRWDAGVRFDVVMGQDAEVLHSSGLSMGSGDVTQLYVTLNVPKGPRFKIGKFVTLMGLEVIESVANPIWSEGLQFAYVENFTATGIEAGFKLGDKGDLQIRVSNGWDRVAATEHKDLMVRLGLNPDGNTAIGLLGYYGAQQDGESATRTGFEVLVNKKFGSTSLWIQGDYGTEEANAALADPTQDATWFAVGGWLAFDASPKLGVAVRVDYLNDQNGFRTEVAYALPGGGPEHNLWSATGNLIIKRWPSVLVRPELRYDKSNLAVFDGEESQLVLGLSVAYTF